MWVQKLERSSHKEAVGRAHLVENADQAVHRHAPPISDPIPSLVAEPLTVEAFKPYGDVIQGFSTAEEASGIDVTYGNGGTALKFNRMAKIEEIYPAGRLVRGGLSIGVMRQEAHHDISRRAEITVTTLER